MANPGQPTIAPGANGEPVRRLQRALRRQPDLDIVVDGVFGPKTEAAVKDFQQGAGLVVDGIVGWRFASSAAARSRCCRQASRSNSINGMSSVWVIAAKTCASGLTKALAT